MNTKTAFCRQFGPWGLVAGGAQGIGAAFAEHIAEQGLNVVVVDVNEQSLNSFATSLAERHGVEVLPVQLDLSAPDLLARLEEKVGDREIGLLVYNAGLADVGPFFKADSGLDHELQKIAVNVTGPLSLIYHYAPAMLRREGGGIILMSSGTALMGSPYYTHYGATKAYNLNLAEGLFQEFKPYNVAVLACVAGMTLSSSAREFMKRGEGTQLKYQSCEGLVSEAMEALGKQPSLICGEHNRQNMKALLALPREQAMALTADKAVDNFLEGKTPKQNV